MNSLELLMPKFVDFIPKNLESGVLYISGEYTTTAHKCACGCGERVVLPLHPTDWRLSFDGKSITMRPSVGNWSFPCRSHYLITNNRIEWADDWSGDQIVDGRNRDISRKSNWHCSKTTIPPSLGVQETEEETFGWVSQIFRFFSKFLGR